MTDRTALVDPNDTPEDVATLYSWANLHGAKYRDFSASRAQTREKARQRVQEAIEAEQRRAREEAEAQSGAESLPAVESARHPEIKPAESGLPERTFADTPVLAAQRSLHEPPVRTWQPAAAPSLPSVNGYQFSAPAQAAPAHTPSPEYPSSPSFYSSQPAGGAYLQNFAAAPGSTASTPSHLPAPLPIGPGRDEAIHQSSNLRTHDAGHEPATRPAWLRVEQSSPVPQQLPQAPEGTLQGSRDRLTSRWFALKGVFSEPGRVETAPVAMESRAPALAVFSLAGGVGKTSMVATLGRALSARGERVLLVDTAAFGLLPFFFGARDQRPGVLRTFSSPTPSDAPIQMLTLDPESFGPDASSQEMLSQEIRRHSGGVSRILIDLATASGATTRRVLRMSPTVLVPVVPDMSSVVSVTSIDTFFQRNVAPNGQPIRPFYVLNQFDSMLPLHLDVREVLREQLGDRLLPFALRRTPAVSEALAEGMTIMDYSPNSPGAEDFSSLAGWVKSLAAPASNGYRSVRWSER